MRLLVAVFLLASPLFADTDSVSPPVPIPAKDGFVFPQYPNQPKPVAEDTPPAPPADYVPTVLPTEWYVVTSETKFFVRRSDNEKVTATVEQGPIRLKGRFAGGGGKIETRNFSAGWIATIESTEKASGRVKLIFIPTNVEDDTKITEQLIDLGVAPQPPPKPDDPIVDSQAARVTRSLTGPTAKSDAVILIAASESVLKNLRTYKHGGELLPAWVEFLKINGWVQGSRPEIAIMIREVIPPTPEGGDAAEFTELDYVKITALFTAISNGAKAVR